MDKRKKPTKNEKKRAQLQVIQQKEEHEEQNRAPLVMVRHNRECASNRVYDLNIQNITIIQGGQVLLDNAELQLTHGRKYGLIGRNGVGKSSLLYALARGDYEIPEHLQVLLVEQEMVGNHKSPLQQVLETDIEREQLLKEYEELVAKNDEDDNSRLVEVQKRLQYIEAHIAESRAAAILGGLGFSHEMINNPTDKLSGGWRMRVSLARALFVQPDILLLDEPTNHLDLDAVIWLEEFIANSEMTILLVSHSRAFLNSVCTDIIHYFDSQLNYYKGDYDQFEKTREEHLTLQKKKYEFNQAERREAQDFIDKFRANAKLASLVQSRIKALDKMEVVEEVKEEKKTNFRFPQTEKLVSPLFKIEDVKFGYNPNKIIYENLNFAVDSDSKIAIIGDNGAGKSTFLNLLTGKLEPLSGSQYKNPKVFYSFFTQHFIDQLDVNLSPVEQLQQKFPGQKSEHYRAFLSRFGIFSEKQIRPIKNLSGGQKSRVALAIACYTEPHLLILDEPTNHLDIDAIDALIEALQNYNGGYIIVSHDEHLVAKACNEIWYVKNKSLVKFKGDFKEYRKALIKKQL
ncbi:hypothetical protein ABPG72_015824 [Tetrahymena utriculariae]